jgi:hypothetical protein
MEFRLPETAKGAPLTSENGAGKLLDTLIDPGDMPGGADAGDQAMTVVHSRPVGQLDRRLRPAVRRAGRQHPRPPGAGRLTTTSTPPSARSAVPEQGAALGHTRCAATICWRSPPAPGTCSVADCVGNAYTARGAGSFVAETIGRVRAAESSGPLTLRADLGLLHRKVVEVCDTTASATRSSPSSPRSCPSPSWRSRRRLEPIPYWLEDGADVAETRYRPLGIKGLPVRLIMRRVRPTPADSSPCSATTTTIRSSPTGPGTLWSLRPTIPPRRDRIRHLRPRAGGGSGALGLGPLRGQRRLVGPVRDYRNNLAHWTGRPGLGKAREALPTRAAGHPGPCCNTRSQSGRWARPGENDPATRVLVTGSSATSGPAWSDNPRRRPHGRWCGQRSLPAL